ncbi:peptidase T [bacterium]|nr:peptidase T [bacterium]
MKINRENLTRKNISFQSQKNSTISNLINKDRMVDHFIKIARIDTGSNPELVGIKSPTTKGQIDLAQALSTELKELGLENVEIDAYGILTATLPSNIDESPTVAFISHLDTSPDVKTSNVNPIIHNYTSGNIKLNDNQTITEEELEEYKGHQIITSEGTTLLGADDKAGISEIIEALRVFCENPQLKRPTIKIAFTPDEECGGGIEYFNIKKFNADVAYTVDGTTPETIDTETFNAFNPTIIIKGVPTHCGYGYKKMLNSIDIASELIGMLPKDESPSTTKDKEGYYHVDSISGNVEETKINMLVRDFDYDKAKERVKFIRTKIDELKKKYPEANFEMEANEAYKNIKNYMSLNPKVIDNAKKGIQKSGLEVKENSVRGGTDGSFLTINGLLCPNIGAGGLNFHTQKEFISAESMKKCCENIINIAQSWVE